MRGWSIASGALSPLLGCVLGIALGGGCGPAHAEPKPERGQPMKIESKAFAHEAEIPTKYTCEGEDVSPALSWSGVPTEAKSLALIVDDPDAPDPKAPKTTWVHWVLFDLPPTASGVPEAARGLPDGSQGVNDWKRSGYGGPCPPIGRHRYFFKLYALDTRLELDHPTKAELEAAMKNHIIAKAELVGTYEKKKRTP